MHRILKHPFIRGTVFLTAANFFISILNYFFNSYAGKILGPGNYGEIAALFSYSALLTMPLSIVGALLVRRLGAAGESRLAYTRSVELWYLKRAKKWWFLFMLPILLIPILPATTNLSLVTSIALGLIIPLSYFGAFYSASVQGLQLFATAAVIGVFVTMVKFIGIPAALSSPFQLATILFFFVLSVVCGFFAHYVAVHRKTMLVHPVLVKPIAKRLITTLTSKQSLIAMSALFGLMVFGTADVIVAKRMLTPDVAGYFAAWNLLSKVPLYVAGPIIGILYILFSDTTRKRLHVPALGGITILIICGGILALWVYSQFSFGLVTLVFSKSYEPVVRFMGKAAAFGTMLTMITVYTQFFVATHARSALLIVGSAVAYLVSLTLWGNTMHAIITIDIVWGGITAVLLMFAAIVRIAGSFLPSSR